MNATLQLTNRIEQPRVPPPYAPSVKGTWLPEQPTEQPKPPCPVGPVQGVYRQASNREGSRVSALEGLEEAYVIEHRSSVAAFIEENRLRGLLLQAREPLEAALGESAIKTLALEKDDEGFETLFCLVMVSGEMQEARRALRAFDRVWWLDRSHLAAGKLNFDFDLV